MEKDLFKPRIVFVDLEYTRIGEIDTLNEKYYADILVQLSWKENCIIEKYDIEKYWNPQIYIENIFAKPDETVEYEMAIIDTTTYVTEKRRIKGYLWERLEIQNFPLDVQELTVALTSKLNCKHLKLVCRNYTLGSNTIHCFVEQQKWRLLNLVECSSLASYDNEKELKSIGIHDGFEVFSPPKFPKMPKICFKCYACRRPYYYFANAYILIFLITITAIGMFSIDCKLPQSRLQTTATILLTSVSFKWTINRALPTVNYTTSLDEYSILCIFYLCLLCAWHSFIASFWTKELATIIDQWMMIFFIILFIIINFFVAYKTFKSYLIVRCFEKRTKEYLSKLKISTKRNYETV